MKLFWKSKTIWLNIVAVAVFVATAFGYADFTPDTELMALASAVLNIALRFLTKVPVSTGKPAG